RNKSANIAEVNIAEDESKRSRTGAEDTEIGARLLEPRPVLPGPSIWPGAARSVRSRPSFQLGTDWLPVPSRCLLVARPPCPHLSGRLAPPRRPPPPGPGSPRDAAIHAAQRSTATA